MGAKRYLGYYLEDVDYSEYMGDVLWEEERVYAPIRFTSVQSAFNWLNAFLKNIDRARWESCCGDLPTDIVLFGVTAIGELDPIKDYKVVAAGFKAVEVKN